MPNETSPGAADAPTKSVFLSRTFAGLLLILIPLIAGKLGYQLDDDQTKGLVEALFQGAGSIMVVYGRLKAVHKLTLTGAGSDAGPAKGGSDGALPSSQSRNNTGGFIERLELNLIVGGFLLIALIFTLCLFLPGCATDTRAGRVTNAALITVGKFAGRVVLKSVTDALNDKAQGLKLDMGDSLSKGLWETAPTVVNDADLARFARAWSGEELPGVPGALAAQFKAINPGTPAEKVAVVNAMARGIDEATAAFRTASGAGKQVLNLEAPFSTLP